MKKRLEDRIIELAFEERDEAAVSEIASRPEAAARLREYRAMRAALGQLRELPDHQLSTQRLRDALLHQGLKHRRAFPWQALSYGATACALFACAFVVSREIRRADAPLPRVVSQPAASAPDFSTFFGAPSVASADTASAGAATGVSTHPAVHRTHMRAAVPEDRDVAVVDRPNAVRLVSEPSSPSPKEAKPDTAAQSGPSGHAAPSPAVRRPAETSPLSNAMVLIQSSTDANTGLDTAQEVSANGDVLVGG